jgi:hypothetical protein
MRKTFTPFVILLLIPLLLSCERNRQFSFLSRHRTGITFRNTIKESENFNVLDYSYLYNGAGVAIGDINNDGLPDIFFTGNLANSRLYLNKGNFKFEDISKQAGVQLSDTWNNGAVMVDVNGDGWLDIYVCSSTDGRPRYRKNILLINNHDLTFTDRAKEWGIDDDAYSTHSTFFDFDKDGDLDLFVLNHSVDRFAMFTKNSINYKKQKSKKYGQKFFINEGDHFVEATEKVGIKNNVLNFGLGVAIADFNGDQWPDIYVSNDFYEQDYLYINQKNGTFRDEMEKYCSYVSLSSMGDDAADINNDGWIDMFTLDMLPATNYEQKLVAGPDNYHKVTILDKIGFYHQTTRNMLQINKYGEFFTEVGQYAGIYGTNWSWSPLICDFDNDGNKDLFISNGYGKNNTHMDIITLAVTETLKQRRGEKSINRMEFLKKIPSTILNNYMFHNNGDLTFTNVAKAWGFNKKTLSNGAAYADLDNDGDMDLVISNINDYAFVYRNNTERTTDNHYLKIRLKGTGKNTYGIGARVDVTCGEHTYTQEFYPSRGYMSSVDYALIFGIGKATVIDSLTIIWPDLRRETLKNIKADQTITLYNKNARHIRPRPKKQIRPLYEKVPAAGMIAYKHQENDYNDFVKQPLLPYLLSTQGPRMATADVNGDGLTDLFIGGAKDQAGVLFIQSKDGTFSRRELPCFEKDRECEDIGALFVDVDNDSDPDLYVVSGGNEFSLTSEQLQDRLYLNNGEGLFRKARGRLPEMLTSGSCVKAADMDQDGDTDLFVGGRLTPGLFPIAPRSYILENDGHGTFSDVTDSWNKALLNPGMITDAVWTDIDGNGSPDLILTGTWMPVRIFRNTGSQLEEITGQEWMKDAKGWWYSICAGDFDEDGDTDYILGNVGENFQIKPTPEEPATIYAKDFDDNGTLDAVMCYYIQGENYPIYSKYDLGRQIPEINERYPTYKSFATETIEDIFPRKELRSSMILEVNNFSTSLLRNLGDGRFELEKMPFPAQLSPIYAMKTGDFNRDGHTDVLMCGNFYGMRIKFGHLDANKGLMLLGDGKGHFTEVQNRKSGIFIRGEVKDIAGIRQATGNELLLFAVNNDSIRIYTRARDTLKPEQIK